MFPLAPILDFLIVEISSNLQGKSLFHWLYPKITYYGNTGCGVFKRGIPNSKGFWLKINCSQIKSFFACNGEVSKSAENWLSKSIFYVKNNPNLSDFFSLKHTDLGEHLSQICTWFSLGWSKKKSKMADSKN